MLYLEKQTIFLSRGHRTDVNRDAGANVKVACFMWFLNWANNGHKVIFLKREYALHSYKSNEYSSIHRTP